MYTYVCGAFNFQAHEGYEYLITSTDNYFRYGYVCLMHRKSNALDKFKEFKAELENQLGKQLKALLSNRGGKYMSGELNYFLKEHGIISQLIALGIPQQNGVSERRNRTL